MLKGHSILEEIKQKIGLANSKIMKEKWQDPNYRKMILKARKNKGHPILEETKKKISQTLKGRKFSEATLKKMSIAQKGSKKPWISEFNKGRIPGNYKGKSVGYRALHHWVHRWLGKPNQCEFCGIKGKGKQIHWANIDHKYKRNLIDWISLCISCHREYDKVRRGNLIYI